MKNIKMILIIVGIGIIVYGVFVGATYYSYGGFAWDSFILPGIIGSCLIAIGYFLKASKSK